MEASHREPAAVYCDSLESFEIGVEVEVASPTNTQDQPALLAEFANFIGEHEFIMLEILPTP